MCRGVRGDQIEERTSINEPVYVVFGYAYSRNWNVLIIDGLTK